MGAERSLARFSLVAALLAMFLVAGCGIPESSAGRITATDPGTAPTGSAAPAPDGVAGQDDVAHCAIEGAGAPTYQGPCRLTRAGGASFAVEPPAGTAWLGGQITSVAVSVDDGGRAEVRGMTTDGVNSRWGTATRSTTDPTCWDGADFRICAA